MMQMQKPSPTTSPTTSKIRPICSAFATGVVLAFCCVAGHAMEPGTLPQGQGQGPDLGPRAMRPQGFPPEPRGLPPRPGSPESHLPPTPPTQAPVAQPTPAVPTAASSAPPSNNAMPAPIAATPDARSTPRYAQVTFSDGMLDVRANDSSLHQILRSIARRTGMKITGGVADQRVFGNYGPAPASSVLATLLDGTGVNLLLTSTPEQVPEELVLTPKTGGATPPPAAQPIDMSISDEPASPPASAASNAASQTNLPAANPVGSPASSGPVSMPQPMNNVNGSPSNTSPTASTYPTTNSVPIDSLPTPSTTPSTNGIVDAPNPPPPGSTTSPAPNAATPESIYQQLLQMQKQQQQKTPAGTGTAPQ